MVGELAKALTGLAAIAGVTYMATSGVLETDAAIGIYGTVLGYVFGKGVATVQTHGGLVKKGKYEQ